MRRLVLLFSLLGCLFIPIVASATMNRDPPATELDQIGNIPLDGSWLLLLGNKNFVSVLTFGENDDAWDQFDLARVNWGQYLSKGQGKFEIADITTYNWGNSGIGNSATTFFLNFREDIGKMVTRIGDYNFDIQGNKHLSVLSNFEAIQAQPVPEPSTTALMLIGFAGLAIVGRKSISHSSGGLEGVVRF